MNPPLRRYAVRRLNPFLGVIQVLESEAARALSGDGETWEIQVLAPKPEHSWRSGNRFTPVMRFFRFGTWNAVTGLGQVPVSPLFDLDAMWAAADVLADTLGDASTQLPFPLADQHELWLLDSDRQPVALAASAVEPERAAQLRPQPWAACDRSDHGFVSPHLERRGVTTAEDSDPRRHASELERLVRRTVGSPARHAWSASGHPRPDGGLPLRTTWPDPDDAALVDDYLNWCAPRLLTLPGLDDPTRDRLEHAARGQALAVAGLFRLYPKILNPGLIDAARVEARLRRAAVPG
jgi:hypothetical protein